LPGPWVDHEAETEAPWLGHDGIVKFIELPVRKAALSRRAFHLYWQRHHSPHVMNATGFSQFMRKYVTNHVYASHPDVLPAGVLIPPRFEGVGEVWLNSLDDATAWLGHPLYAELIAPDETRFIDANGDGEVLVAREERLHDTDPDLAETGLTRVHMMVRKREDLSRDEFHRAVSGFGSALLEHPDLRRLLRRFVISHRLNDPYPDWLPPTVIDAVLQFCFDDRSCARRFFAQASYLVAASQRLDPVLQPATLRGMVTRMLVVHDEFSFQSTTMQSRAFDWRE
jgi:EthD domain